MKPHYSIISCDTETPIGVFSKLSTLSDHRFLFESAEIKAHTGRYSMMGFGPLKLFEFSAYGEENPFTVLRREYEAIRFELSPELPRFQAGFVGYFSYETIRHLEKIPLPTGDGGIPESLFYLPRFVVLMDHIEQKLYFIAYSEEDLKTLEETFKTGNHTPLFISTETQPDRSPPTNDFFEEKVRTAQESIKAGEAFQIVISQKFTQDTPLSDFDLYRKLRIASPSPYMYYMAYPDFSIVGSSPETLVRTEGDDVIIRPIAGTRRRGKDLEEDHRLGNEMASDPKEIAEHMMLVDLGRNDLGRVCKPGTIRITQLMTAERFSHVMHLVSEIHGTKKTGTSLFDIFKAVFPAGTLTGAPKVRAMELIAKLENEPRGIYGGAVGYFDLSGSMDFAIAIRTMIYKNGHVELRTGAGIVYDSTPQNEDKECHNKARGPLSSLTH